MLFSKQIGSATTGFIAAVLWFKSAVIKSPPMTWEGVGHLETSLNEIGRLNKWAAGLKGISILLFAAESLLSATGKK